MLPITCVAHIPGPVGMPVQFGYHTFERAPDGQLAHSIDGQLRALVPPEGWDGYAKDWPQCAELVAELRRPTSPAPASLATGSASVGSGDASSSAAPAAATADPDAARDAPPPAMPA